eukprot:9508606-Alexandrium_andersonii.AAC.1
MGSGRVEEPARVEPVDHINAVRNNLQPSARGDMLEGHDQPCELCPRNGVLLAIAEGSEPSCTKFANFCDQRNCPTTPPEAWVWVRA